MKKLILIVLLLSAWNVLANEPYPKAKKDDLVEIRFKRGIHASYRWMENLEDYELWDWVKKQNDYTKNAIAGPIYQELLEQFKTLFFYRKQKYLQKNHSPYQNPSFVKNQQISPSKNYKIILNHELGTDLNIARIYSEKEKKYLSDFLIVNKIKVVWEADEKSFLYFDYGGGFNKQHLPIIRRHFLGRPQKQDKIILEGKNNFDYLFLALIDKVIYVGKMESNNYVVSNLGINDEMIEVFKLQRIPNILDCHKKLCFFKGHHKKDEFETLFSIDMTNGQVDVVILPKKFTLDTILFFEEKIFVTYLDDAEHRLFLLDIKTDEMKEIEIPKGGTVYLEKTSDGKLDIGMNFYDKPFAKYEFNEKTNQLVLKGDIQKLPINIRAEKLYYRNQRDQKIPIWFISNADKELTDNTPVYLTGYGGFGHNLTPNFNEKYLPWLKRGGAIAVATLPGSFDYGLNWRREGIVYNKNKVFIHFAMAASHLINIGYTNKEKLAIGGGSNGGLLVAATSIAYPKLFKASVPESAVLDLTRFQLFLSGRHWIGDYGNRDNRHQFYNQLNISPLHLAADPREYPSMLIMTADNDDRVVPSHSFKFAATLQETQASDNRVLLYTRRGGGHQGQGATVEENAKYLATKWAFLIQELEL